MSMDEAHTPPCDRSGRRAACAAQSHSGSPPCTAHTRHLLPCLQPTQTPGVREGQQPCRALEFQPSPSPPGRVDVALATSNCECLERPPVSEGAPPAVHALAELFVALSGFDGSLTGTGRSREAEEILQSLKPGPPESLLPGRPALLATTAETWAAWPAILVARARP